MLRMFKKAGDVIRKKLLLANGEDNYNDDYYEDEDDYYDDEYENDPMQEHYSHSTVARKVPEKSKTRYADKIVELGYNSSQGSKQSQNLFAGSQIVPSAVIAHPKEIKDACKICDDICNGKMVIVDLSSLDSVNAQRIADYLGGVVHTIQGNTDRVNKGIFVISPKEYDISASGEEAPDTRDFGSYRAISR